MAGNQKSNKLLRRMLVTFLPACVLPLFAFGYYSIHSHYASLHDQHLASHKTLISFMGSQLDSDVQTVAKQLERAAEAEVLKSDQIFLVRDALEEWQGANTAFSKLYFLSDDHIVRASYPIQPELDYKPLPVRFSRPAEDGVRLSPPRLGTNDVPYYYAEHQVLGFSGEPIGYLVAEVTLASWSEISRKTMKDQRELISALIPLEDDGELVRLSGLASASLWKEIGALGVKAESTGGYELNGEDYHVTIQKVARLPARLVVAQPSSVIYKAPREVLFTSLIIIIAFFGAVTVLLFFLAKGITDPIQEIADAAVDFSEGKWDRRAPVKSRDEVGILANTFNTMVESLQKSQHEMRILYQSVIELFACGNFHALMQKTVELTCTQCQADVAWLIPQRDSDNKDNVLRLRTRGNPGFMWTDAGLATFDRDVVDEATREFGSNQILEFRLLLSGRSFARLFVAYHSRPDEAQVALLEALIALVEMAIAKQDLMRKNAMIATELTMAETLQRSIISRESTVPKQVRMAFHYQAAERVGGDFFSFSSQDGAKEQDLYFVIGDVTGHGLPQGLMTTAVLGVLGLLDDLVRDANDRTITGPGSIIRCLEMVVAKVASRSQLSMTSLAAQFDFDRDELKIVNAGHTFPILIRRRAGRCMVQHLVGQQHRMLSGGGPAVELQPFAETAYALSPGDVVIFYTDGLTEAQSEDHRAFNRPFLRQLKSLRDFASAEDLKSQILDQFAAHTKGRPVQDDVCFVICEYKPAA